MLITYIVLQDTLQKSVDTTTNSFGFEIGTNLIIGVIGSVIAALLVFLFTRWYRKRFSRKIQNLRHNKIIKELGEKFYQEGLTKFHFSRDDYGRTLSTFIETATSSIVIVSISLKITQEEGRLTDIFRKKLAQNPDFFIVVSLVNPNNQALVKVTADTLNISDRKLKEEIMGMLKELIDCYNLLNTAEQKRMKILVHNCFPMGSVLMLDATPTGGMIQIETKLYKSARNESFGFQLTKESPFFKRNYVAWNRVIQDSEPLDKNFIENKLNKIKH